MEQKRQERQRINDATDQWLMGDQMNRGALNILCEIDHCNDPRLSMTVGGNMALLVDATVAAMESHHGVYEILREAVEIMNQRHPQN
jgi:hypothetical protein